MIVFNYGGGRQTIAMVVLIAKEILPKPDVVIMADTSRENPMTWEYFDSYVKPLLTEIGLSLEIASHDYATTKDIYALNGDILLPAFTRWLGLAFDEKRRWSRHHNNTEGKWTTVCPLVDLMLNTQACLTIVKNQGWPEPQNSSCWMCPQEFKKAVEMDNEIRDHNHNERNTKGGKLFLHHSRSPLREANLDEDDTKARHRQCTLGMCFV